MSYNVLNIEDTREPEALLTSRHAKYFIRFLNLLPARLASHDSTRCTIAFFSVAGLDVLNSLHLLTPQMREHIIEWIYGSMVEPREGEPACGGFLGSRYMCLKTDIAEYQRNARPYQCSHLALTYTSIGVLITLGDDLGRINRKSVVDGVAACQKADGSFSACLNGEYDMRFVYCAASICYMLDYWGDVDKEKMFQFIKNSIRYDYGISQYTEGESHGGTTFCALAALQMSGQLHRLGSKTLEGIKRWLLMRQVDGFQGRPNKPVDTCYSFWIGASLRILDAFQFVDFVENRKYILETQDNVVGGFSKWPQSTTDPFHTYFGLCGLSFMGEPGLAEVMPSLNISMTAYHRLLDLHKIWETRNVDECYTKPRQSAPAADSDVTTPSTPLIAAQ